jgi:large subunit ribosomal protein L31e
MERVYTIPLREVFKAPKPKRANKAVRVVKDYLMKHTKAKTVKLDASINDALWANSREKPPRKIKVKAVTEEGIVTASLVVG